MPEREVVRETREVPARSGGAGWFIAGILVVVVVLAGLFLFGGLGYLTGSDQAEIDVEIEAPAGGGASGSGG